MFTINSPENPHLPTLSASTLKSALEIKIARERCNEGCHFLITDSNGYVVSTLEQRNYLCGLFF